MLSRFQGTHGLRLLVDALRANRLVECGESLARCLAEKGELVEFLTTMPLIKQGAYDNDLFLLIAGEVDVFVNGRFVATRGSRESVGEMALIEPAAPRSARVVARTHVVALKVTEPVFREVADEFPSAIHDWVAHRLQQ